MKVSELIENLKSFDPDASVVVLGGLEVGFDDVTDLCSLTLTDVFGRASGRGPYETPAFANKTGNRTWCPPFGAVFIGRYEPNIVDDEASAA